ncbi:MAG: L-2-amino-thiazoline-4-carboxylic acid hydrolase [Lachnospiraceae bacterium]|nr:L-2-amino-thiazoline-4-carboxylic acid hydrolase [Lachnospiraceae bacterium]
MKYSGMPAFMWLLYKKSFRDHLVSNLGFDADNAKHIAAKAKPRYKSIIEKLPDFEKGDRFQTNIVNCALLIAFLQSMDRRPSVEKLTKYYANAMSTKATKIFCKSAGISKFSAKDIEGMKKTAALNAADRNPYSWNMEYLPYNDGSGYEARFTKCGICALMKEYGFFDLVPAMCNLDYVMSEMGGASTFVREYTLASGGPYCDCGYKKKFGA